MVLNRSLPTSPLPETSLPIEQELFGGLLIAIIESADDAIISKDLSGTITSWNRAAERIFGYTAAEMIGQSVLKLIPEESKTEEALILETIRQGRRVDHFVTKRLRRDGSRIDVSLTISPVKNRAGRIVGASKIVRDITAEKAGDDASRRLAAIVDSSDDAIISKSLQGIISTWNHSAERIFGYSAEEAVGKHITLLIPEDRWEEEPQIIARLQRGERVEHFETVRRHKDGRLLDISLTISPVRNADGVIIGASKIARDITERKNADRALEAARAELAEMNRNLEKMVGERTASLREAVFQMEEFSYTVSHDLRAPLRAMQTYSDALLEEHAEKLDAEGKRYLERIIANARRMEKMVVDLLTYARVNRGEIKLAPVQLDRLAREIVENYPALQPQNAEINLEPLGEVVGHEPSLVQALANLLTNAVKFVAPGVRPKIRVYGEAKPGRRRVWVEDNGIGVPPSAQPRLFRMFERMNPSAGYEGNGVGLAIVRKAVSRMGGEAGMESDGESGSRFWIELPTAVPVP